MIREWLERHAFHWQNLNDGDFGDYDMKRAGWVHGRAWLNLLADDEHWRGPRINVEWSHGKLKLSAQLNFNRDEREVMLNIGIPGASYYVTLQGVPASLLDRLPFKARRTEYSYMGSHRSIGFRVFDGALWLSLWEDMHEWRSSDPKWWRARIGLDDIADFLFGKVEYSTETIEERDVEIPMYEGVHQAQAKRTLSKWTRPRWPWKPFSKERVGVSIDIPKGIRTNHKGPLFGISTPAKTIAEGIGHVVSSVLRTRGQYVSKKSYEDGPISVDDRIAAAKRRLDELEAERASASIDPTPGDTPATTPG